MTSSVRRGGRVDPRSLEVQRFSRRVTLDGYRRRTFASSRSPLRLALCPAWVLYRGRLWGHREHVSGTSPRYESTDSVRTQPICSHFRDGASRDRTDDLLLAKAEPAYPTKAIITGLFSWHGPSARSQRASDVSGCVCMCSDLGTRIRLVPNRASAGRRSSDVRCRRLRSATGWRGWRCSPGGANRPLFRG